MHFPCPLLLTSFHFCIQWIWSFLATEFFFPEAVAELKSLSWQTFCSSSIPCGLVTALDVGLSNLSLVYITITFYTMVKSATPIFVLLWAYILRIERITYALVGVVLIIAAGEFLTVIGEAAFDMTGFLLCLSAAVLSGARWTLVQLKLRSLPITLTTLMTMRWLAPSMFFSLLVLSAVIERPWRTLEDYTLEQWTNMFGLGVLGGCIAVAMVLCEFYLILKSNAFMLMIGGVLKEMVTIVVGVTVFHDRLNWINSCGVVVVFLGVAFYKAIHLKETTHDATQDTLDNAMKENKSERGSLVTGTDGVYVAVERDDKGGPIPGEEGDVLLRAEGLELRNNTHSTESEESKLRLV